MRRAALRLRPYDEYRVEVPFIDWNGRQLVRVSAQGHNAAADAEAQVEALRATLPARK